MSWFELPHPDNLYIGFERMHPRVRWLLTIFILFTLGVCWYFFAYHPLNELLHSYKYSLATMQAHAEQLPLLLQQQTNAERQLQDLHTRLRQVDTAAAQQPQPCVWIYQTAKEHNVALMQCSLASDTVRGGVSLAVRGKRDSLEQFTVALHGLSIGWAFESLQMRQESGSEDDATLFLLSGLLMPLGCTMRDMNQENAEKEPFNLTNAS